MLFFEENAIYTFDTYIISFNLYLFHRFYSISSYIFIIIYYIILL